MSPPIRLPVPSRRARAAVVLVTGLLLGATGQAQTADGRSGTLKTVQGDVSLLRGDTVAMARPGDGVGVRDRLVTGGDGAAALTLRDGSQLLVGPRSSVALSRFEYEATTQQGHLAVDLLRGSLRFITGLIARQDPSQVRVTTPTAVVGVRGTDFIVEAP